MFLAQRKKDKIQFTLNVHNFELNEVDVQFLEEYVVVKGKHEEKQDDQGLVSREFTRKYQLPKGTKAEDVSCTMSSDRILCISVESPKEIMPTPIPIVSTGRPAAAGTIKDGSPETVSCPSPHIAPSPDVSPPSRRLSFDSIY